MNQSRKLSGNQGVTHTERLERRKRANRYIWPQAQQRAANEAKMITVVRTPERTMHEHRERLVKMRERRKHGNEQGESGASAEPANLT